MNKEIIVGIYCIHNITNDKRYIGESVDIYRRWNKHIQELRNGAHINVHLQNAWNKYREDNFEFNIIEECEENNLPEREKFWIKFYDSFKNGYNQTEGGEGCLGYKHNKESKEKMKRIKTEQFKDIKNREKLCCAHEFESYPIYQIDFNGNIIKEWSSANWAAKMLGCSPARIYEALNHKNKKKTYGGYIWIYVDKYDPYTFDLNWYIKRNWNYKTFYQYDSNYNLVNVWETALEAEKYGFLKDGIYKVTNKNRKYKGFYWFDKRLNEGRETV